MKNKTISKNIITSLFLQLSQIICTFITARLIISTFGSETNGLINSITQFLTYISLLESGFGPVVKSILYKPIAQKNKSELLDILKSSEHFFRIIATIFIPYIFILCLLSPLIFHEQFNTIYTVSLIIIIAISTFAEYFFGMTYRLFLQAKQQTYIVSIIRASTLILSTITMVILMNLGFSIQIVELSSALIFVLRPILQNLYVKYKYHISLKNTSPSYKIPQKWNGLAQHIAAVIHNNTDIIILTLFSTLSEVSVYSVYLLVMTGIKKITQAFNDGIDASFGHLIAKNDQKSLNEKFSKYEFFYHTIITIIFICTILLITPFVNLYTEDITDANYNRPIFGIIFAIAEFIWAIRLPYSSTVLAAGHFKQTQKGAVIEAALNIVISTILVFNLGIIGVAIGTLISMFIRTIEFMYHNSKYILKKSPIHSFSWFIIIAIETTLSFLISSIFIHNHINIQSYSDLIVIAIIVLIITSFIVLPINYILHKKIINTLTNT